MFEVRCSRLFTVQFLQLIVCSQLTGIELMILIFVCQTMSLLSSPVASHSCTKMNSIQHCGAKLNNIGILIEQLIFDN